MHGSAYRLLICQPVIRRIPRTGSSERLLWWKALPWSRPIAESATRAPFRRSGSEPAVCLLSLSPRICLNQIKRNPVGRAGVSTTVVDIHSHILPEVDDGSKSWDISVAMCKIAATDGITHQVATPHANDRYHYDREYLQGLVSHLQGLIGPTPEIILGCDFHLSYDNVQAALADPSRYAIGNTRYMLVELSNYSVPPR